MASRKKILIADNNPEVLQYLSSFIPLVGAYDVEQASNHIEILAKINAFEPELMILDLLMPSIDGKQILKEVKKKHPQIKILIITEEHIDEQTLTKQGAHEILSKPFDLTDLSQKVKKLLPLSEEPLKKHENARLLIADDEPFINECFRDNLEPLGIEVYTACDGKEALRIFKQKSCNLAILDLRMPKISGADLVRFLKASSEPPEPKVIIIVTAALGNDLNDLRRLGCPVFNKPMDTERLKKEVLEACTKFGLSLKN